MGEGQSQVVRTHQATKCYSQCSLNSTLTTYGTLRKMSCVDACPCPQYHTPGGPIPLLGNGLYLPTAQPLSYPWALLQVLSRQLKQPPTIHEGTWTWAPIIWVPKISRGLQPFLPLCLGSRLLVHHQYVCYQDKQAHHTQGPHRYQPPEQQAGNDLLQRKHAGHQGSLQDN